MAQLNSRLHAAWPTWAALASLVLLFLGERPFRESSELRWTLVGIAAALVLAALSKRALEWMRADSAAKPVAGRLLLLTAGVLATFAIYGLEQVADGDAAKVAAKTAWMVVVAVSVLPLLAVELAVIPVAYTPVYEHAHIRNAHGRATGLGLLAAVLALGNYIANENDSRLDLARGNRATPSEPTLRAARELTKDIQVTLFWPRANEVGDLVASYFEPIEAANPKISVRRIDHALAGEQARKAGITENGWLEVRHDTSKEKVRVGTKIRSARSSIRRLDRQVLEAILKVTVRERVAYVTTGHGERALRTRDKDDSRAMLNLLRRQLEAWQFKVKTLSVGEGSTSGLPEDASLVIVAGPEKPFLAAELEVLQTAKRLLILLESERDGADGANALLSPYGLSFDPGPLVNARAHLPLSRTKADRALMWTNRYSSHPSLTTMSRNDRLATVFGRTGFLRKSGKDDKAQKVDMVMTAVDDTFIDQDGDLERGETEPSANYALAAAVTRTSTQGPEGEGRVFVLADTDLFADELLKIVQGNFYLFRDVVAWLQVDEDPIVPTVTEKDVRIVHQAEEDAVLFYGTTFVAPLFVLGLGWLATRRRRHR